MEALESSQGVQSFAGPKDLLPRHTLTARIEVDCRMPDQVLPGGHLLPAGVSTVVVLQRDLPAVMGMVEDNPEGLTLAREGFEAEIDREVAEDSGRSISPQQSREARRKAAKDLTDEDKRILDMRQKTLATTAWSIEAEFHRQNHRGINPLRSVKVLERDRPLDEVVRAEKADADRTRLMFGDLIDRMVAERVAELTRGQTARK